MFKLLVAALLIGTAAQAASVESYPRGQLPDEVTPTHYALDLTVVPDQATFSGTVAIDVQFKKSTDAIWIHGRDLAVSRASVVDSDGATIPATWTEIPKSDGVVRLTFSKPVRGPSARIVITYSAPFNRQLEGIYRSDEGGESYAYSQMEPISARLAFPSFDEPRFKTPYDIALTVRENHAAVSNTPVVKTDALTGGMKRVQFATTKPLPTYLIALLVGPFDVVDGPAIPPSAVRDRAIPLRGITAKGKGEQIKYALANTAGLLLKLEEYFGIAYPYEKLDIIAATDFSAGAMENAGAIVYREPLLLMDEKSSVSQHRRYASVHAHEMAHQWVGDLVTPMWWNDIWLNEAFATWMSNKVAAAWDSKGEYGRSSLNGALGAMSADSKTNARRIAQPIESNDDIENAFDGITYEKGGGVLSMFEQYYGTEAFRKGVHLHLQRHAFGNATARDFLQSVADANNDTKGVAAFESFLNQPGVPLIAAQATCTGKTGEVAVSQSRYMPLSDIPRSAIPTQSWKVPLCVSYGSDGGRNQTCSLVEKPADKIKLPACPAWIMPNADGAGYYRFSLDKNGWAALASAADALTDKEVLAALDSLGAAFDAGELDVDDYVDRLRAFAARKGGLMTWDAASSLSSDLIWMKDQLVSEGHRKSVQKLIAQLYRPLFEKIGLDANSDLDRSNPVQATLLRGPVINMIAVQGRVQPARGELAKRGAAYAGLTPDGKGFDGRLHPEAIDVNQIDQALGIAVQDVGAPMVDALFTLLKTERNGNTRGRLLGALLRATDPALAARVRDLALGESLRVNEAPMIVFGSMGERDNRVAAWAWFKSNYAVIKKRTPTFDQGDIVAVGGHFCSSADRDDYKAFFEPKLGELTGAPRVFSATLEDINHCLAMIERQRAKADTYFPAD